MSSSRKTTSMRTVGAIAASADEHVRKCMGGILDAMSGPRPAGVTDEEWGRLERTRSQRLYATKPDLWASLMATANLLTEMSRRIAAHAPKKRGRRGA